MRTTRLVAVAATFAVAGYETSAQANDFNKLGLADTSSALTTTDAVQPNKTRSLRGVDPSAEPTLERTLPRGVQVAEISRGRTAVKTVPMKAKPDKLPSAIAEALHLHISPSRKELLKTSATLLYGNGLSTQQVTTKLREGNLQLKSEEDAFVEEVLTTLEAQVMSNAKAIIDECIRGGLTRRDTRLKVKGHREAFRPGELTFIDKYYLERYAQWVKEEAFKLFDKGYTVSRCYEDLKYRNGRVKREGVAVIRELHKSWEMKKKAEEIMAAIKTHFMLGHNLDEIHARWKTMGIISSDTDTKFFYDCIEQLNKSHDAEMQNTLEQWAAQSKSVGEVRHLLESRTPILPASLISRDVSSYVNIENSRMRL